MPISKVGGGQFRAASACWGGPCQQIPDAGGAAAVCLGGRTADCTKTGWNVCAVTARVRVPGKYGNGGARGVGAGC
jgi:hypothetical protein